MNKELEKIFSLSREAVVVVEAGRVAFSNPSADALFGLELMGRAACEVVPTHILDEKCGDFVSSASIRGVLCQASCMRQGERLIAVFSDAQTREEHRPILSDRLMSTMLSSLFNVGLSIDLVSACVPEAAKDDKSRQYLSILHHNYYAMKRVVSNLSTAYSLQSGTYQIFPRRTDLAGLCSDLASTVSVMLGRGVTLDFRTDFGHLAATVDPDGVERIILNLISNSYRAVPDGGRIELRLFARSSRAVISVSDNGGGISPEKMKSIFSFREPEGGLPAEGIGGGSGLGLCVSRGIAEAHGGSLIIETSAGKGASVCLLLPLDRESSATFASAETEFARSGMDLVLTELAGELDSAYYSDTFRD